jgi:hypothetical protein
VGAISPDETLVIDVRAVPRRAADAGAFGLPPRAAVAIHLPSTDEADEEPEEEPADPLDVPDPSTLARIAGLVTGRLIADHALTTALDHLPSLTVRPGQRVTIGFDGSLDGPDAVVVYRERVRVPADGSGIPAPPLGVLPLRVHAEQRAQDLRDAHARYIGAGLTPPPEWATEHNSIVAWIARDDAARRRVKAAEAALTEGTGIPVRPPVCGTACHNPNACIRAAGGCERRASVQGEPLKEPELAPEHPDATAAEDRPAAEESTDPLTTDDDLAVAAGRLIDRLYATPAADAVDVALAAADVRTLIQRRTREKAAEYRHATVLAAALDRLLAADPLAPGWGGAHGYAVSALAGWHAYLDSRAEKAAG